MPMDGIDCVDERGAKEELVPQEELVPMDVNEQGQDQESREDAGPEPGRCTVCGELDENIPFPYCLFCTDQPCYHHGAHCPVRRHPVCMRNRAQRAAPQAREPARSGSEPAGGGSEPPAAAPGSALESRSPEHEALPSISEDHVGEPGQGCFLIRSI